MSTYTTNTEGDVALVIASTVYIHYYSTTVIEGEE